MIERAWRCDAGEPVTAVYLECRRRDGEGSQLLGFTIEHALSGGALKDGVVTAWMADGEVESVLSDALTSAGLQAQPISPGAAADELAAARQGADAGIGPLRDALPPLALALRAAGVRDAESLLERLPLLSALARSPTRPPRSTSETRMQLGRRSMRCSRSSRPGSMSATRTTACSSSRSTSRE
jgi:hypothetical protein